MSLIIENDKDRRSLAWLEARFTAGQIAEAVASVEAIGRKPYLSHVTKALGARIPDDVWGMQPAEFEAIRAKLQAMRDSIAAEAAAKQP